MTTPPGPRGLEVLRVALGRRRSPLDVLIELERRYGDLAHVRVGDTHQFIVGDLAHVKHVLVDNARNYTKGPGYALVAEFLGRGLVTSEGEQWRRNRRVTQPLLQRDRMHGFIGIMIDAADAEARALMASAESGSVIDVFDAMMSLTLRIVSRALLGADVSGREAELHAAVTEMLDHVERLSASPLRILELIPGGSRLRGLRRLAARLPTRATRRFHRAMATLDTLTYGIIARHRSERSTSVPANDLVTLLLDARDDDGAPAFDDHAIRDEVMTMLLAGHETIATALTWCFHLLSLHPEWREHIAREAEAILGTRAPTLEDMPKLTAAQRVFEETMRLYPPVWRISRFAAADDRLGEYDIPAGSIVVISPYLIHHGAAHWTEPERFDPTRFSPERTTEHGRLAFLPFGAGQRMCIGTAFATVEAQIILSAICRVVHFESLRGLPVQFEPRVTLRPLGGMPLRVHRVPGPAPVPGTPE